LFSVVFKYSPLNVSLISSGVGSISSTTSSLTSLVIAFSATGGTTAGFSVGLAVAWV